MESREILPTVMEIVQLLGDLRETTYIECFAVYPERMADISRWSPSGAPPDPIKRDVHPEGMPDPRLLAPLAGCTFKHLHNPVVALR